VFKKDKLTKAELNVIWDSMPQEERKELDKALKDSMSETGAKTLKRLLFIASVLVVLSMVGCTAGVISWGFNLR